MWTAICIIICGMGMVLFPKYFRHFRTYELFKKVKNPNKRELIFGRFTGSVLILIGIMLLLKSIRT